MQTDSSVLSLGLIRRDGGTQPRDRISSEIAKDYAEAIADGASLPAVTVFYDGTTYWLADGFHRAAAHEQLGLADIAADIRQGTQRDAILYSVGANTTHGHRRSNADKRRAVLVLLNDAVWGKWSDNEIARRCFVSQPFVSKVRPNTNNGFKSDERTFVHPKTGQPTTMNTSAIGKTKADATAEETMETSQAADAPSSRRRGQKMAVPEGANIIELCREGLEIEATGRPYESVADELGLNSHAYKVARQIVLLGDRTELSTCDKAIVAKARDILVTTLQYTQAWEVAEPVALKFWGNARWDRITTLADRRMEQFERTFGIIMQSCLTTNEVELPYLSAEQVKQCTLEIERARKALATFSARIKEIHG